MGHARFALCLRGGRRSGRWPRSSTTAGRRGVDLPSHLFQTWLYSHAGFNLWNNYWYAGRYEFVTYSVLYYPVASRDRAGPGHDGRRRGARRLVRERLAEGVGERGDRAQPVVRRARRPSSSWSAASTRSSPARPPAARRSSASSAAGASGSALAVAGDARLLAARIRASHGGARRGAARPAPARRGAAPPSGGVRARSWPSSSSRVLLERAFPSRRLVPVRPDRRGHRRSGFLARRALHHRDEPAGEVAADALRLLPGAQPGRLPLEGPDWLELEPPLRDRRSPAPVARSERQPGALAGSWCCRSSPRRSRSRSGRSFRDAYSSWGDPASEAVLLEARASGCSRPTPTRSTASRSSPPAATGRRTTSPSTASRSRAGGTARTTSRRTARSTRTDLTGRDVSPLAALARRPLRPSVRRGARLQRDPRGRPPALRRCGPRARSRIPSTGRCIALRHPTALVTPPPGARAAADPAGPGPGHAVDVGGRGDTSCGCDRAPTGWRRRRSRCVGSSRRRDDDRHDAHRRVRPPDRLTRRSSRWPRRSAAADSGC